MLHKGQIGTIILTLIVLTQSWSQTNALSSFTFDGIPDDTSRNTKLNELLISSPAELSQGSTANIERIKLKDYEGIPNNTLMDAVANVPSVYNLSTGNGINKPVIRGLSGMRVVTYLNGLRIENQQWGGDHGIGLTDIGIDNVEIIKGPSSLLYGADAMGGVMYLCESPFANENNLEAFVRTQYHSVNQKVGTAFGLKLNKNNVLFNLFGNFVSASDYALPDGSFLKNSRFSQREIKSSFGYSYKNWTVKARYTFNNGVIGLPGHTHESVWDLSEFVSDVQNRAYTIPAQRINNHYALVENNFYLPNLTFKLKSGFTSNNLTEYEEKITIPGIDMNLQNIFNHLVGTWQIDEEKKLLFGGQTMFQSNINSPRAEETIISNNNSDDIGAFAILVSEGKKLQYQLGARYDFRRIQQHQSWEFMNPWTAEFGGFNYSAGLKTQVKKWDFRLNASSGFRPPHISETLAYGVHHGTARFEIGTTDMQSELANQLDLSINYESKQFDVTINPYAMLISNYIYIAPTDTIIDGYPVFEYLQDDQTQHFGGDISLRYRPEQFKGLSINHNFSIIKSSLSNGGSLPLTPPTRANTIIQYNFSGEKKIQLNQLNIQHLYHFSQNDVATFETASADYHIFNLGGSLVVNSKYPIEVTFGVNNLLNESYIPHLSRLKNFDIPSMGRNIQIGLKLNIESKKDEKANN